MGTLIAVLLVVTAAAGLFVEGIYRPFVESDELLVGLAVTVGQGARMSRRRFLYLAGGALGASMVSCGGGVAMLAAPTQAVGFGQSRYGKGDTMKRTLVAYASRYGSTAEIAQAIAERLGQRGETVDVRSVEMVDETL